MSSFIDQLGRTIHLVANPKRIISVVPSQTELLFDLGLGEHVVGITKFCIHPENWFRTKTRVGGTKNLDFEKIRTLQPDLVIANKEENTREQIELLSQHYPVWVSDINNLEQDIEMIGQIGLMTETAGTANDIIRNIEAEFETLQQGKISTCAYLIWKDPMITVGGDCFIHSMLAYAGYTNVYSRQLRYPETSLAELKGLSPEFLFLSSEPYPFKEMHQTELQQALPHTKVLIVDGEFFSWYGSRLPHAAQYFKSLRQQTDALRKS